ncbi:C4-dicarboxylate transporter DctA, partial [Streptomyces sp. NPDC058603]
AVALLLGADRIMDSMRVVVNLLGNCVAVFVVSRWDGALDLPLARRVLTAPSDEPVTDEDGDGDGSATVTPVTDESPTGTSTTDASVADASVADASLTDASAGRTPDQAPANTTAGG